MTNFAKLKIMAADELTAFQTKLDNLTALHGRSGSGLTIDNA